MTSTYEHITHDPYRFVDITEEPGRMLPPLRGYEDLPLVSLEKATDPLVSHIPDIQDMVHMVRSHCVEPKDGLTMDESASIMLYSMEWLPRENSFHRILNRTLRDINREQILPPWFLYLRLFLTALSKLPSHIDEHVYRGVKLDLRDHYHVGSHVVWCGFSSCTSRIHVLENAPFFGTTDTRTLFSIQCESGKNIKNHSFFHTEDEIVLIPGLEFEVTSCLDTGNSLHMIQLREIQNRFPHLPPVLPMNEKKASPTKLKGKTMSHPALSSKLMNWEPETSVTSSHKNRKLTETDVQRVINEMLVRKQSHELDLSWSKINNEGAAILAEALKKNQVNRFTLFLIRDFDWLFLLSFAPNENKI